MHGLSRALAQLLLVAGTFLPLVSVTAANVQPGTGYTSDFSLQPSSADWSTLSRPGTANDDYTIDSEVANIAAGAVTGLLVTNDTANPPAAVAEAAWSSAGLYLQTRPTGNRCTLLLGKFVNNTGTNATEIALSYLFTITGGGSAEEAGRGTRLYYSLTGETNTWVNLASFNIASSAAATSTLSTNLALSWANGAALYLLWADDNATGNPTDSGDQIDNFSLQVTAGLPPFFVAALSVPANNAVFVTGNPISTAATTANGTPPYRIEFFTNSGAGNTAFVSAGSSTTPPYNVSLGSPPAGIYNVYAVATDSADSAAISTTLTNTFFVANPITLTLDAPADNSSVDNTTPVNAAATVSGGTPPYGVQFYLDDAPNGALITSLPYERNFGTLFVGDHTVRVSVTDARGWTSNSPVHTVHVSGPLGISLTPTNGASFNFGQSVTLQAAVGGGTSPYVVTFHSNDQLAGTLNAAPFSVNLGALAVGSYTNYAAATDSTTPTAQQVNSGTNIFTVVPNPITVTLTSPTNGQTANAGGTLPLNATASVGAPLTVTNVQFFYDGTLAGSDNTAPYSASVASLVSGAHTVYAAATDNLGRRAFSATNQLSVVATGPPPNDQFANAIPLSGPTVTAFGSNVRATKQFGGEPFQVAGNFGGASVWWTWTAAASGPTTIDTLGSDFNTLLGVFVGNSANQLQSIAENNDFGTTTQSRVQFNAVGGTVYRIYVDGFRSGGGPFGTIATGNIVLNIQGVGGVDIVSPTNGMQFTFGDPIPLVVNITTNFPSPPASRVEFYRGTTLLGSVTNQPFTLIATNTPAGSNSFSVIAFDSTGKPVQSPVVRVVVLNEGVTLLSPEEDTMFITNSSITVLAGAALRSGSITNIEFFVDGIKFGEDASSPFSATWSNLVSGSHRLTAIGRSDTGASYNSQPVNIGVAAMMMPFGSVWKYLDNGSTQDLAWVATTFDDSSWASGPAPLGYSDSNGRQPATTNAGGPVNARFPITYYRQSIVVSNIANLNTVTLSIERDDGAIVYLNGAELARFNMPTGTVAYSGVGSPGTELEFAL